MRGQLAFLWSPLPTADDTYRCIGRLHCYFKIGCVALGDRDGSSRTLEKRLASRYFSTRRLTKATTVKASTSSTSHITIVGLNIVDPSRTLYRHRIFRMGSSGVDAFLSWIPAPPMFYSAFRQSHPRKALPRSCSCRTVRSSLAPDEYIDWISVNHFKLDFILSCRLATNSGTIAVRRCVE